MKLMRQLCHVTVSRYSVVTPNNITKYTYYALQIHDKVTTFMHDTQLLLTKHEP